jgi:DNA-binding NtrC family response regulator
MRASKKAEIILPEPREPSVFVVDDEEIIASTVGLILLQSGFRARTFHKPLEALEAARLEAPDVLLTDVLMPQLSGVDLAIQIQACCPDCKILLFSAQGSTSRVIEAAIADGHEFELFPKPVRPAELVDRVRSLTEALSPRPPLDGLRA